MGQSKSLPARDFKTIPASLGVTPPGASGTTRSQRRLAMTAMITNPAPRAPTVLARNMSTRVHKLAMDVMILMAISASIHVSIPGVPTASAPSSSTTPARPTVSLSLKRNEWHVIPLVFRCCNMAQFSKNNGYFLSYDTLDPCDHFQDPYIRSRYLFVYSIYPSLN